MRPFHRHRIRFAVALLSTCLCVVSTSAADHPGVHVYKQHCASCHGDNGEGVRDKYNEPLIGDRSLASLTRYIERQMPEEKPEHCVGDDAKAVASYIYDRFYSVEAQLRHNRPRIELARLTVNQYANTVADLLLSFHGQGKPPTYGGLKTEVFNDGRGFDPKKRVIDEIRPLIPVRFEGQDQRPAQEIPKDKNQYTARVSGTLFAPDTGDYEFIIDTPNGMSLWVNDRDKPVINEWVRSGDNEHHTVTVRLLGGRNYYFKLEAFKEKRENIFAVTVKWKPPHGIESAIPPRYLAPETGTQLFVTTTPFPPDDNSRGYERGSAISQAWDEATTSAALDVANYLLERMPRYVGASLENEKAKERIPVFLQEFVERAFRDLLTDAERKHFITDRLKEADTLATGFKTVVVLALKSPRFLYLNVHQHANESYRIANRLSYALWDSMPDRRLLDDARGNRLAQPNAVTKQVERMLADPRAHTKLRQFILRWLRVDDLHGLSKNAELYPDFDAGFIADLRTSLDLFVVRMLTDDAADFRQFFLSDKLIFNKRLATYYGLETTHDDFFALTDTKQQRAGVLTHPLLMAGFAYSDSTSPIHRGVFVSRNLLGRRLRSPPDSIVPDSPELHPDLSTRERITKQTRPTNCMTCHDLINPLGFTMEHFDAVGRFRTTERNKAIDASGAYVQEDGTVAHFTNARSLAEFLVTNREAQNAFVERLFKDAVKQPILAYGADEKERLRLFFLDNQFNIRKLAGEIAKSIALSSATNESAPQTAPQAKSP